MSVLVKSRKRAYYFEVESYVLLNCNPGHEKEIITHLKSLPEVMEVNGIWGNYDIFVKVTFANPFDLEKIIEKMRKIENITNTISMPVLYGQGGSIDD